VVKVRRSRSLSKPSLKRRFLEEGGSRRSHRKGEKPAPGEEKDRTGSQGRRARGSRGLQDGTGSEREGRKTSDRNGMTKSCPYELKDWNGWTIEAGEIGGRKELSNLYARGGSVLTAGEGRLR